MDCASDCAGLSRTRRQRLAAEVNHGALYDGAGALSTISRRRVWALENVRRKRSSSSPMLASQELLTAPDRSWPGTRAASSFSPSAITSAATVNSAPLPSISIMPVSWRAPCLGAGSNCILNNCSGESGEQTKRELVLLPKPKTTSWKLILPRDAQPKTAARAETGTGTPLGPRRHGYTGRSPDCPEQLLWASCAERIICQD